MMTIVSNTTPPGLASRTLSVLVEDNPGVLNRVSSLLRRRRFNVDSLNVGASEQPGLSRMTISLHGDETTTEQAMKQLYKLIEVRKVVDLSDERLVTRELALIKVTASDETRATIREIADMFKAQIADVSPKALVIEAVGSVARIESLLDMLRPYGIKEIARTGRVAVARGANSEG